MGKSIRFVYQLRQHLAPLAFGVTLGSVGTVGG